MLAITVRNISGHRWPGSNARQSSDLLPGGSGDRNCDQTKWRAAAERARNRVKIARMKG
jgi:hypothetical protein